MGSMFQMLGLTCGFISLFCYGFVVYKTFTEGETVMSIICGIGFLACGLGMLLAFVYGWMKSGVWEIKPVMFAWTGFWTAGFICKVIAGMMGAEPVN